MRTVVFIAIFIQSASLAWGAIVCPDCEVRSIKEALEAAQSGETVTVRTGTYVEGPLAIVRPVSLVAEGRVVVDARGEGDGITVRGANDVTVSGFTVVNTGVSYLTERAAIKVENGARCKVLHNLLPGAVYGIFLADSSDCLVEGNVVHGASTEESDSGDGIHIWQGQNHQIVGNRLEGLRDGIYFEFVTDSSIRDNVSCSNLRYGLHFMFSHRDVYTSNTFCKNGAGVAVMYSKDITMTGNEFSFNTGSSAYGLLLKDITNSTIVQNKFLENTLAVYMEGANRNKLRNNVLSGNGWAVRILGSSEGNQVRDNNFSNNTFDISTNSSTDLDTFSHNYWSGYTGYDLDRNGIGDIPYRPVSLSSLVSERLDASFVFLRSPLFQLLDRIESALPTVVPEQVADTAPLMRPVSVGGFLQ